MNDRNIDNAKRMADYNTQKDQLLIREYGRNTQNLINHAKTIEDKEERQAYIEEIVRLIMSMHPHTRNVDDYELKVWSHVLKMANYDLEVEEPDNLPDARARRKPDKVNYPSNTRRLRHYGANVRTMIEKAKHMEDKEKQTAYIAVIGAYMKMSYKAWNRESVQDEVIIEEFSKLSRGELTIPAGTNLDSLISPKKKKTGGNSGSSTNTSTTNMRSKRHHNKNSSKTKKKTNKRSNNHKNQRSKKR
ncbi:MAG: DUF4290 domain-containing protein [Aureispira sp.]